MIGSAINLEKLSGIDPKFSFCFKTTDSRLLQPLQFSPNQRYAAHDFFMKNRKPWEPTEWYVAFGDHVLRIERLPVHCDGFHPPHA